MSCAFGDECQAADAADPGQLALLKSLSVADALPEPIVAAPVSPGPRWPPSPTKVSARIAEI
jgi:hypothetical protein